MKNEIDPLLRCTFVTKKGIQCKRKKTFVNREMKEWCAFHNPNKPPRKDLPDEERCTFVGRGGKRCRQKKYCTRTKVKLTVCKKHITTNSKEIEIGNAIKQINSTTNAIHKYKNWNPHYLFTTNESGFVIGALNWMEREFSVVQKEHFRKIQKIKTPLRISKCILVNYINSSSLIFEEGKKNFFIFSNPNFRYFTLVQKNYLFDGWFLSVYDRSKCGGDVRKPELVSDIQLPLDPEKDILNFLFEDTSRGKLLLAIEKEGVNVEKIDINLPNKKLSILPPREKNSHFFSKDELSVHHPFEDYVFTVAKNSSGGSKRGVIEQSFLDSGMVVCRYSFFGCCP